MHLRALQGGLIIVLLVTACGLAWSLDTATLESRIDAYLEPVFKEDLISGSVLIAQRGDVILAKGYGLANREYDIPNSPETKFRLGSMTKQFTAMGIMILTDRGLVSVDDPVSKYLPDYPGGGKITLHHLLTHTSGIPNYNDLPDYEDKIKLPYTIDQVVGLFKDLPLQFEPGEKFAYSNSGYVLLAKVIEVVSGKSYVDFLQENIFRPLGMTNTGQDNFMTVLKNRANGHVNYGQEVMHAPYRDMPFMSGAGSLYSTPMDLLLWDQALYTERLISKANQEKMFTPYKDNYGYGWFIENRNGRNVISHRGDINGFMVNIERYIDDSLLIVVMFNYESTFARGAFKGISDLALGAEPKPLLVATPPVLDSALLDKYAGRYLLGGIDTLVVAVEQGLLQVTDPTTGVKMQARPQNESLFFVRGLNSLIRFKVEDNGAVSQMILATGAAGYRCPRL